MPPDGGIIRNKSVDPPVPAAIIKQLALAPCIPSPVNLIAPVIENICAPELETRQSPRGNVMVPLYDASIAAWIAAVLSVEPSHTSPAGIPPLFDTAVPTKAVEAAALELSPAGRVGTRQPGLVLPQPWARTGLASRRKSRARRRVIQPPNCCRCNMLAYARSRPLREWPRMSRLPRP